MLAFLFLARYHAVRVCPHHMANHTHHNTWVRCALQFLLSADYLPLVAMKITSFCVTAMGKV